MAVYDELLAQFGHIYPIALHALGHKGTTLLDLGRAAEAIPVLDEALSRLQEPLDDLVIDDAALIMTNKIGALVKTDADIDTLLPHYDRIDRLLGQAESVRHHLAAVLQQKVRQLYKAGRDAAALAAVEEFLARFAQVQDWDLLPHVVRAHFDQVYLLDRLGRQTEALAKFDEIMRWYDGCDDPDARQVIGTIRDLAVRIKERLAERSQKDADSDPMSAERLQRDMGAIYRRAFQLDEAGDKPGAMAALDELAAGYPGFPSIVVRSLTYKGLILLEDLKRPAEALPLFEEALQRIGADLNEHVIYDAARARAGRITALVMLDRDAGTVVPLCDEMIHLFGATDDPNTKPFVARVYRQKADFLRPEQHEERIAILEEMLDRFAQEPCPELAEDVLWAAYKCAWDMDRLDRPADAAHVFHEIMPWMTPSDDARLQELQEEMTVFIHGVIERAQAALDAEPSSHKEPGV
ncbi:MAG: hypothetical protein AB7G39_00460 [Alphaproteobacteria bacterium]